MNTTDAFLHDWENHLEDRWVAPVLGDYSLIPKGDMPGDKVEISNAHVLKAKRIFPSLLQMVRKAKGSQKSFRIVISVHGGSGVGKSEIASLLSYYFNNLNLKSYVLSGDNYPHRIPMYNDANRYKLFREAGMKALKGQGLMTDEVSKRIEELKDDDSDANPDWSINTLGWRCIK
jgi:hypothetical protein